MTRASDLARLIGAGATINDGTTITTADNDPQLILTSTDADGDRGPVLQLKRDSGSPADNDTIGRVQFLYDDDGGNETTAIQMEGTVPDVSDGSEDATFNLVTMVGGTTRGRVKIDSTETIFNDDGVALNFRVEGDTNANMLFVDGGNSRVGIGTNSPSEIFEINSGSGNIGAKLVSTDSLAVIAFKDNSTSDVQFLGADGDNLVFYGGTSPTERMRINSSGHVLLGTTTDGTTAVGTVIRDAGEVLITRASNPPLLVNRTTDSGDIIEIRNDNSRVGSIQQRFGSIQVGSSNTNLIFNSGASEIAPSSDSGGTNDSVLTLGANNRRFKNIFMNGTIFNEKTTYALENTEGMVIDDSAQIIMESDNGVLLRLNRMNGNGHGLQFYRGATNQVGSISFNTSSTTFNTSSDYRLKENVSYDFDATSRLKKLKPARFNFKTEKDITVDGFLAHEVSDIVPEAVSGEKDAMTKEVLYVEGEPIPDGKKVGDVKEASKIDPQGIDQSKLVPLLVKTIQELEARITALEGA